jgi:hypothetical protein
MMPRNTVDNFSAWRCVVFIEMSPPCRGFSGRVWLYVEINLCKLGTDTRLLFKQLNFIGEIYLDEGWAHVGLFGLLQELFWHRFYGFGPDGRHEPIDLIVEKMRNRCCRLFNLP